MKHLSLSERIRIEASLQDGKSFSQIASKNFAIMGTGTLELGERQEDKCT